MIREISKSAQMLGINLKHLLKMAKIDQSTYYKIERGEYNVSPLMMKRFKRIFIYLAAVREAQETFNVID